MPESVVGLDARIEWFYRKVCAEFDAPVSQVFVRDVVSQFKKRQAGTVSFNTKILTERTAWAICETLKVFDSRINAIEVYHNVREDNSRPLSSREATIDLDSRSSKLARKTACKQASQLIGLFKSLTTCRSIKLVCDPDCYPLVHDTLYNKLILSLSRGKPNDGTPQPKATPTKSQLNSLEIVGSHFRPSFFSIVANCLSQGRFKQFTSLTLENCGLMDAEGVALMRAVFTARESPQLQTVVLARNHLTSSFAGQLIQLMS